MKPATNPPQYTFTDPAPPVKGVTAGPPAVREPVTIEGRVVLVGVGYGVATTAVVLGIKTEDEEAVGATAETVDAWDVVEPGRVEVSAFAGRETPFWAAQVPAGRP